MFDKNGNEMSASDVVYLVLNDGRPEFFLKVTDPCTDYRLEFDVYAASGWCMDEKTGGYDSPCCNSTPYLHGIIKWDGCSHIWFGDEEKYQHLCGKAAWENHVRLMTELFEYASKNIKNYNKDVAE